MKIILELIIKNKRCSDAECGVRFFSYIYSNWIVISTYKFRELEKINGMIETTYDERNNYKRNSNFTFIQYEIDVKLINDTPLFDLYLLFRRNELAFLKQKNLFAYKHEIYYLGLNIPYCLPTNSKKGYFDKNVTKKEILCNSYVVRRSNLKKDHIPKFLKEIIEV